jgi:hypothetical protein
MFEDDKDDGQDGMFEEQGASPADNVWADILNEPEAETKAEDDGLEDPTGDETVEVLRDRVKARNRALRQSDKAISRMQAEIRELQTKSGQSQLTPELIAALRGTQQQAGNPDEEREKLLEAIAADPLKVVELMDQKLGLFEQKVVDALSRRDQAFEQRLKQPVPKPIANAVAVLKQRPEYAGFTDEQLETVARTTLPVLKQVSRPPAGITGTRVTGDRALSEKGKKTLLDQLGY